MGIKMPQFSSCCYFLPLRTGLLTLGYINLISHGLIGNALFFLGFMSLGIGGGFPSLEWALLLPLVMGSEVVFNILVVVATHKKDARLLKVTFIIGTALWIFTVLYSICLTCRLGRVPNPDFGICMAIFAVIFDPIVLGYVLLLVRSLKSMIQADETPGLHYSDLDRTREATADYERFDA